MRTRHYALLGMIFAGLCVQLAEAQVTVGRWSVGIQGGVNILSNDYRLTKIAPGVEALAKFGISPNFSVGFLTGYDELKTQGPPAGFELGFDYLRINCIPVAGLVFLHPFPRKLFALYFYGGGGAVAYRRSIENGVAYPDSKFRISSLIVLGVGLEYFFRPGYSFVIDGGYRFVDKNIDVVPSSTPRGWETIKLGMNVYLAPQARSKAPAGN